MSNIVLPVNEEEYKRDCQLMYEKGKRDMLNQLLGRDCESCETHIRADYINSILDLKPEIFKWLIKRDTEGYGTTLGECTDKIFEEIEKKLKVSGR